MTRQLCCLLVLTLGCVTHPVALIAPGAALQTDCFHTCEALFGSKPTLNCGEMSGPTRTLICNYEVWPVGWSPDPTPDAPCRAECAVVGFKELEACQASTTSAAKPATACQYRVGFH